MAVQQRKKSKQQCRQRHSANSYKGLQTNKCSKCGAAVIPHRACGKCGNYKDKQVIDIATD